MDERTKELLKIGGAFLVVILFAIFIFKNSSLVNELVQGYGLVGLLIASVVANASIFLPVPIDILIFAVAAQLDNFIELFAVAFVTGFGAAIGEMTAYIMGLLGVKTFEKAKHSEFVQINSIREKLGRKGELFIFLGALTPFPFDIIGITAGLIKYDMKKFFLAAFAGKFVRYLLIGIAALYGLSFIREFFLF